MRKQFAANSILSLALLALSACGSTVKNAGTTNSCGACVANTDCVANEQCSMLTGGAFCTPTCASNSDCSSGLACLPAKSSSGSTAQVCQTADGACLAGNPDSGSTTPDSGPGGLCADFVAPSQTGGNCVCQSGQTCAANNCSNGQYCDIVTNRCTSAPPSCVSGNPDSGMMMTPDAGMMMTPDAGMMMTPDAGMMMTPDAGMTVHDAGMTTTPDAGFSSSITAKSGGTESQLYFAVIGDTRPLNPNDNSQYPASPPLPACTSSNDGLEDAGSSNGYVSNCGIVTQIYQDIQALNPRPPFVIGTGDYQFVSSSSSDATTQVGYYMTARGNYSGVLWPAMGNHECNGSTDSNCGTGNTDGVTANLTEYLTQMLTPIGETNPWFQRTVKANDNSWSASFIFVAPNDWTSAEQTYMTQQLSAAGSSSSNNYVFVIHHEDAGASSAPSSLAGIESAEASVETMSIVGHSHFWNHGGSGNGKQLLVGNGGAPLSSNFDYFGYTTVLRQPNGQLLVNSYNYMTNQIENTYTVTP